MTTTQIKKPIFVPLGWQIPVWRSKALVILLDGPAGAGRSFIAATKIDAFLRKYLNATGLMVRKTRESMTNSTLLMYDRKIVGDDPHVRLIGNKKRFEYANGSILAYGGMKDHSQREAIRSIGQDGSLDIAWMEEAHLFTLDDFEELLGRMRGKAAGWVQLILTTNPDSDQHWIYQHLILGGGAERFYATTKDNPHNPDFYAEEILGRLTGVRRKRLKDGRWVAAEGAVYEDYRYETHVIEPFEIPDDWTRFRSIDFGYRNPFVCQWWALDEDDRMYLYREIYMSERTVATHADTIKRIEAGFSQGEWDELTTDEKDDIWRNDGERIAYTVTDHDAEDRATLRENGIQTTAAQKAITVGIEKVQERFVIQGDGRPRIFFFNDALIELDERLDDVKKPTNTVAEMSGYSYHRGQDGKPVKEEPVDIDNHGMDAMRYAVMSRDGKVQPEVKPSDFNPFRRGR